MVYFVIVSPYYSIFHIPFRETRPHYIRCIKPNDNAEPDEVSRVRVMEQLRYGGVLEAVRVARSGYPVRLPHKVGVELPIL